jgi:hypothetical protein
MRNLPMKKEVVIKLIEFYTFVANNQTEKEAIHAWADEIYSTYASTFLCDFLNDEELSELIWGTFAFIKHNPAYKNPPVPYTHIEIKNKILPTLKKKYEEIILMEDAIKSSQNKKLTSYTDHDNL